jgi:hypothetical protein
VSRVSTTEHSRQDEFMRNTGQQGMMDKNAFLQLLITQLRYQDPMKPADNGEFLAQMAQFTSLEQTQNLNEGLDRLIAGNEMFHNQLGEQLHGLLEGLDYLTYIMGVNHSYNNSLQFSLLGKEVVVQTDDGIRTEGKITAIRSEANGIRYIVNDQAFRIDQIIEVKSGEASE